MTDWCNDGRVQHFVHRCILLLYFERNNSVLEGSIIWRVLEFAQSRFPNVTDVIGPKISKIMSLDYRSDLELTISVNRDFISRCRLHFRPPKSLRTSATKIPKNLNVSIKSIWNNMHPLPFLTVAKTFEHSDTNVLWVDYCLLSSSRFANNVDKMNT